MSFIDPNLLSLLDQIDKITAASQGREEAHHTKVEEDEAIRSSFLDSEARSPDNNDGGGGGQSKAPATLPPSSTAVPASPADSSVSTTLSTFVPKAIYTKADFESSASSKKGDAQANSPLQQPPTTTTTKAASSSSKKALPKQKQQPTPSPPLKKKDDLSFLTAAELSSLCVRVAGVRDYVSKSSFIASPSSSEKEKKNKENDDGEQEDEMKDAVPVGGDEVFDASSPAGKQKELNGGGDAATPRSAAKSINNDDDDDDSNDDDSMTVDSTSSTQSVQNPANTPLSQERLIPLFTRLHKVVKAALDTDLANESLKGASDFGARVVGVEQGIQAVAILLSLMTCASPEKTDKRIVDEDLVEDCITFVKLQCLRHLYVAVDWGRFKVDNSSSVHPPTAASKATTNNNDDDDDDDDDAFLFLHGGFSFYYYYYY
jgi:hypothetical protein